MDIIDLLLLGCLSLELLFFFFLLGPFNVANEPWQFFVDPFGKFLRYSSYELEFQLLLVLIAIDCFIDANTMSEEAKHCDSYMIEFFF